MAAPTKTDEPKGVEYAPGVVGKRLFRVSERYVADHVAPLIQGRRWDAAKLDLVLRGLALLPAHAGKRKPGLVLRRNGRLDYAALHDLVRDPRRYAETAPEDDDEVAAERAQKREWVRDQLQVLESRRLLIRSDRGDGSRDITMLSDLGNGEPYDDPGAKTVRRSYVTVLANVLIDPRFRAWTSRELVGFYCAMVADRFARNDAERRGDLELEPGSATWYRQADWFNNENGYRPGGHVIQPFSTTTIERGLKRMRDLGYISGERKRRSPEGKWLSHPRMIYTNHFDEVGEATNVVDLMAFLRTGS